LVLYDDRDRLKFDFCRYSLPYAGYILAQKVDPVLIVAQNGGSAVACALAAGAREVTALATDPARARALAVHYGLPAVDQDPRVFLAGSAQRFAVIHIDDWGPTIPGTAALDEGHLLTVDAFGAYLDHLAACGRIIVSRHLLLPPADTVRLYAAAWEALEDRGAENPSRHLALIRNFDSFTLLVSASPLPLESPLHRFVRRMNFDWIFAPGIERRDANRFNRFEAPFHFDTVAGLERAYRDGTPGTFLADYPLDAAPQSDYRPYPHRFLKWTRAAEIYRSTGRRMYALLLSGEIVVAVLLVQAVVVATFLLVPAIWAIHGRRPRVNAAQVVFFAGVGAGFMFVELFYIKAFALLFGNPVISLALVLAGLLVASGIGGLWSERLERGWLPKALGALTVCLGACSIGLFPLMQALLGYSGPFRCAAAMMVMMPAGILMGVVFSIGMRCLPRGPADRVVAWTANGCLSVVSAIGAAQIALSLGIPALLGLAIAGYLTAWMAVRRASD
jgi:hypothetical protein